MLFGDTSFKRNSLIRRRQSRHSDGFVPLFGSKVNGGELPVILARYWRIRWLSAQDGGATAAIAHVEMYSGKFGGENLAVGGTPIGTNNDVSFPLSAAFDTNITNFWADNIGLVITEKWLGYDFGAGNKQDIKTILMQARPSTSFIGQSPSGFALEYSDDQVVWTERSRVTGITWVASEAKLFRITNPVWTSFGVHRYWRIFFHKKHGSDVPNAPNYGCAELELMTTVSGADITTSGMSYFSVTNAGFDFVASKMGDNNDETWFVGGVTPTTGEYAGVDLGVGNSQDVLELSYRVRSDILTSNPQSMRLQCSEDNVIWKTVYVIPLQPVWTLGEKRIFTLS